MSGKIHLIQSNNTLPEVLRNLDSEALLSRKDERVSAMLTTFVKQTQSSEARASAQDWLRRIDNQP